MLRQSLDSSNKPKITNYQSLRASKRPNKNLIKQKKRKRRKKKMRINLLSIQTNR